MSFEDVVPLNSPEHAAPPLWRGDPAPWFRLPSDINPQFNFSSLGGRTLAVVFARSFSDADGQKILSDLLGGLHRFVAHSTAMLIISADAADQNARVPDGVFGVRYLFDADQQVAKLYGVAGDDGYKAAAFVIDERMRVAAVVQQREVAQYAPALFAQFDRVFRPPEPHRAALDAPVLIIPNVFEPDLCKRLIDGHAESGGVESGYMVERNGVTVQQHDFSHKRRSDWVIEDQKLVDACRVRVKRRIVPEIFRAHQFVATHIERYLIACYEAGKGGHFAPHRDNTTKGTAHRRFAISVNLNDDYEGGELVFPEFGQARFKPETGGACVFSCSLLHQATKVTAGNRYVFVPFLYDEAAAEVRRQNLQFIANET